MSDFKFIEERRKIIPEETKVFAKMSLDILERIEEIMELQNLSYKDLANSLGKSQSEISKWIRGTQNFTISTLAKLQVALKDEIINIPCKRNKTYELQKVQRRMFDYTIRILNHRKSEKAKIKWVYFNEFMQTLKSSQNIGFEIDERIVYNASSKRIKADWQELNSIFYNESRETAEKEFKQTQNEAV
jgi:transcriptional regulator with XRE-family HTH domain